MTGTGRRAGAVSIVAAVGAVLVAGACGNRALFLVPPPPRGAPDTSTTEQPDLSGVDLSRVAGSTTTTVAVQGGGATLNGSVQGPDGPVAGAVVHAERLVGDGVGSAETSTQPDGTWQLPGARGGRYRVRAWRQPDLALVSPQVFFLGGSETRTLNLRMDRYNGPTVAVSIAPNPPFVDSPANLVVSLGTRTVSDSGVVRTAPISATVVLSGSGGWTVDTPNPTTTSGSGRASWGLTCV
ncbi:MAG TPA: carboxypeptidase-like regulatory domain-containing protein, partial [Acidimicrobiales bacterium]|nr:carboxypeptidase-like regulatory domain-containing protein [Acidimicrobiales bacterium]